MLREAAPNYEHDADSILGHFRHQLSGGKLSSLAQTTVFQLLTVLPRVVGTPDRAENLDSLRRVLELLADVCGKLSSALAGELVVELMKSSRRICGMMSEEEFSPFKNLLFGRQGFDHVMLDVSLVQAVAHIPPESCPLWKKLVTVRNEAAEQAYNLFKHVAVMLKKGWPDGSRKVLNEMVDAATHYAHEVQELYDAEPEAADDASGRCEILYQVSANVLRIYDTVESLLQYFEPESRWEFRLDFEQYFTMLAVFATRSENPWARRVLCDLRAIEVLMRCGKNDPSDIRKSVVEMVANFEGHDDYQPGDAFKTVTITDLKNAKEFSVRFYREVLSLVSRGFLTFAGSAADTRELLSAVLEDVPHGINWSRFVVCDNIGDLADALKAPGKRLIFQGSVHGQNFYEELGYYFLSEVSQNWTILDAVQETVRNLWRVLPIPPSPHECPRFDPSPDVAAAEMAASTLDLDARTFAFGDGRVVPLPYSEDIRWQIFDSFPENWVKCFILQLWSRMKEDQVFDPSDFSTIRLSAAVFLKKSVQETYRDARTEAELVQDPSWISANYVYGVLAEHGAELRRSMVQSLQRDPRLAAEFLPEQDDDASGLSDFEEEVAEESEPEESPPTKKQVRRPMKKGEGAPRMTNRSRTVLAQSLGGDDSDEDFEPPPKKTKAAKKKRADFERGDSLKGRQLDTAPVLQGLQRMFPSKKFGSDTLDELGQVWRILSETSLESEDKIDNFGEQIAGIIFMEYGGTRCHDKSAKAFDDYWLRC